MSGRLIVRWWPLIILAGCATVRYGPYDEDAGSGYIDRAVAADTYYVEFVGHRDRVTVAKARRLARRRCGELAVARGWSRVRLENGRGGLGETIYRHDQDGHASCLGGGGSRLSLAACRIRGGRPSYERRADRVYYRIQCRRVGGPASAPSTAPAQIVDPRTLL